jgi:CheY-like chemotaxis protein
MNLPEHFEIEECTVYYRPVAKVSFQEATALVSTALAVCHESGVQKLIFDATGLTGFGVPSTMQRFNFAERLARDANGIVVAIVAPQQMIDPQRFGTTVARNRGAVVDIFSSESDARNWLHAGEVLDSNASVIVIEDDQDTSSTIEQLLLLEQIRCKCVTSRDAALSLIKRGVRPACILVDYMMPGMSLSEFLHSLSVLGLANSRIVLATAHAPIEDVAARHGIRYMLRKPIDPDELLEVVRSAVESHSSCLT